MHVFENYLAGPVSRHASERRLPYEPNCIHIIFDPIYPSHYLSSPSFHHVLVITHQVWLFVLLYCPSARHIVCVLLPSRYDLGWHHSLPRACLLPCLLPFISFPLLSSFHLEDCSSFRLCPDIPVTTLIYEMAVVFTSIELRRDRFMIR